MNYFRAKAQKLLDQVLYLALPRERDHLALCHVSHHGHPQASIGASLGKQSLSAYHDHDV
jgi:hypothetical protein